MRLKCQNKSPEVFNFIKKETLAQVFSCEFWEIFKKTVFTEHLLTTISETFLKLLVNNLQKQPLDVFCKKKMFLKILQNSQENTCARVSFLIKLQWHRCFPVNFAKFLRTFLQDTSGGCF